jgi:predicted RNA-binding Zn-ribbon protein involved in translation (DUF1610 family)
MLLLRIRMNVVGKSIGGRSMQLSDEKESAATEECSGCGITFIGATSLVFCPDCGMAHSFCARCAADAIEALAA